jgi:hypothetical protein
MGTGPNYGLDKGFLAQGGAVAYTFGELVLPGTAVQSMVRATAAPTGTTFWLGVCQETVDATKVGTGKVFADVRINGISRVIAGGTITVGARLTNDTSARAVAVTRAAAGAQPVPVFGVALTGTTNVGEHVDVLLTPGATY